MKFKLISAIVLCISLVALSVTALPDLIKKEESNLPVDEPVKAAADNTVVRVALLLDTSNSMDGLIEQALRTLPWRAGHWCLTRVPGMSFGQGFVSGLIISVIVTIFSPLTQWITSVIITPEFFPNVIEYSVKTGYHKSREEAEAYFSLENYVKQGLAGAIIMGAITSLVVAFFVKTKKQ